MRTIYFFALPVTFHKGGLLRFQSGDEGGDTPFLNWDMHGPHSNFHFKGGRPDLSSGFCVGAEPQPSNM